MRFFNYFALLFFFSTSLSAQTDLIAPSLTGNDLIQYLETNYSVSNAQSYSGARDAMFEEIDGPDGTITCAYTGFTISFTDRQDAQGDQSSDDFNTEHLWPQSFFDSELPMRSDIHHLLPTRVDVNGARSNFKFDEISDNQTDSWWRTGDINTSSIPTSNIDEYSELLNNTAFEPREDLKGNVARAMFYFWSIYQNNSDIVNDNTDNEAFFNNMKDVLLDWHELDPVDQTELDRSLAIENVQGNRNPFIHDSTLVRRAYFGGQPVSNEIENEDKSSTFTLHQNYPNPFNPSTNINFELSHAGLVEIDIYSTVGTKVAQLVNSIYSSGNHTIAFNASNLSGGVYFYKISFDGNIEVKSMTLVK